MEQGARGTVSGIKSARMSVPLAPLVHCRSHERYVPPGQGGSSRCGATYPLTRRRNRERECFVEHRPGRSDLAVGRTVPAGSFGALANVVRLHEQRSMLFALLLLLLLVAAFFYPPSDPPMGGLTTRSPASAASKRRPNIFAMGARPVDCSLKC